MKVKDELESSGWRLGMLLNTLKRLDPNVSNAAVEITWDIRASFTKPWEPTWVGTSPTEVLAE